MTLRGEPGVEPAGPAPVPDGPLRRRWRAVKRRTGTVDREAVQWLFATCGVIASALGVAQFIWPDASTERLRYLAVSVPRASGE